MIFESNYRRKALDVWKGSNQETKQEIAQKIERKRHLIKNPVLYALVSIFAIFTQQQ